MISYIEFILTSFIHLDANVIVGDNCLLLLGRRLDCRFQYVSRDCSDGNPRIYYSSRRFTTFMLQWPGY